LVVKRTKFKDISVIPVIRYFNERYGTLFYKKHLSDDEILQIVYLFLTGYSIGKMPPMFEVTDYTIRKILRMYFCSLKKFK